MKMNGQTNTPAADARSQAVLSVGERLQFLPGMAYGLKQTTMLCRVSTRDQTTLDFPVLDRCMQELIEGPVPSGFNGARGPMVALLERMHHWQAALQRDVGIPVFNNCFVDQPIPDPAGSGTTSYLLAIPYANRNATHAALRWVVDALNGLLVRNTPEEEDRGRLRETAETLRAALRPLALQSTNIIHFLSAADQMDMQVTEMTRGTYCFGQGMHSRWLNSSITDETPSIAVKIARNKDESARILGGFGLPVPPHAFAGNEDQAVSIAEKLIYPVVIKPNDQDQGRGVFAGLRTAQSVRKAFREAQAFSKQILVEKHFQGEDYRFTVFHEQVIKIMHRRPGGVLGDGTRTVTELLTEVQAGPDQQRAFRRQGKMRLQLDQEALDLLTEFGMDPQTVPTVGQFVPLRRKSNISSGGSYVVIPPEQAHPDNCALAVRAARVLGLDLAGIDLLMADAARPWHETGAIICEVNAQPQIGFRDTPEIYGNILRDLVRGNGAIPVHLVLTDGGQDPRATEHCRQRAAQLGCNAFSTDLGAWVDGVQCVWRPANTFIAAKTLLNDRKVRAVLIAMRVEDILRFGSPAVQLASIGVLSTQDGLASAPRDKDLQLALVRLKPHASPPDPATSQHPKHVEIEQ